MSLVRLLTAGKSLVGLQESESRYRVTSQRLLPKFEAKKNPFGAPAAREPGPKQPVTAEVGAVAAAETPAAGTLQPDDPEQAIGKGFAGRCSKVLSEWFSSLRCLIFGRREKGTARRRSKRMVQSELSLEAVRVVRNDLSDSDVEVVARNTASKASEGPVPAPTRSSGLAGMADRLFGAGKH